jgi:hypothetical protein
MPMLGFFCSCGMPNSPSLCSGYTKGGLLLLLVQMRAVIGPAGLYSASAALVTAKLTVSKHTSDSCSVDALIVPISTANCQVTLLKQ